MSDFNPVSVSHRFVRKLVRHGDRCVDATVGNGHDTAFLAELVGETGQVLGVDIQADAILKTQQRFRAGRLENRVSLWHCGHESLSARLAQLSWKSIKLAMFNLGYLPGSDKSIVTNEANCVKAFEACKSVLELGGAISVIAYRGHDGGMEEYSAVDEWFSSLSASEFLCLRYERWTRQRGRTPIFYWAEKRR